MLHHPHLFTSIHPHDELNRAMKNIPLKSRLGCRRCRERRKKCDEVKPVCGECSRLGFICRWRTPDQNTNKGTARLCSPIVLTVRDTRLATVDGQHELPSDRAQTAITHIESVLNFDRPSILRTSAVPDDGSIDCKNILQYLSERGTTVLRCAAVVASSGSDINLFRAGFPIASQSSRQLQAILCLGAGALSKLIPSYEKVALKYYTAVMSALRADLLNGPKKPPAEWMCAVAATLSFYELIVFHSPESRLAHLIGFHRLVELRLRHNLPWGPLKMMLEQYIHSLTIGTLFHQELLAGQKSITHVDNLIEELNDSIRPLGPEIVGVPEELTAIAYKLAILNVRDIKTSPWDVELEAAARVLANWKPALHALRPSAAGLLLVAKLYQLACICLLQIIKDRSSDGTNELVSACLQEADGLLKAFPFRYRAFNSMIWPLTVLSIFAVHPEQQANLEQPILVLVEIGRVEGYRSILSFLSLIRNEEIGPEVLQRPDLLQMVHM